MTRSRRVLRRAVAGALAVGAAASASSIDAAAGSAPTDRPVVVVTTNILGDIVGNVAGDTATIVTLMPPGADPHNFGISAVDAAQLTSADLVVANGLGLEAGLETSLASADDAGVTVVEIGPHVDPIAFGAAAGDDEGDLDPHIWTDPERMIVAVKLVEAELAALVAPGDRDRLAANAAQYTDELTQLVDDTEASVETIPVDRRRLVTNHHVFGYFAERFDFEVIGAVLPSGTTLASPSAADLADLADTIDDAGVPAIFADASHPDRLAQVLAEEANIDVAVVELHTESLGPPGSEADSYLTMMASNVEAITTALRRD